MRGALVMSKITKGILKPQLSGFGPGFLMITVLVNVFFFFGDDIFIEDFLAVYIVLFRFRYFFL